MEDGRTALHSANMLRTPHEFRIPDECEEVGRIFLYCHNYAHGFCVLAAEKSQRLSFMHRYIRTLNFLTSEDDIEEGLYIQEEAVENK